MVRRLLGKTGLMVSPIGFGAFKIGRNESIKYAQNYELPSDVEVESLLDGVFDLGVNYFDTAPAYGSSEERMGRWRGQRPREGLVVSTKAGEVFEDGQARFDFSETGLRESAGLSRKRLGVDVLDVLLIHSNGDDLTVLNDSDAVATLRALKNEGIARAIGFSGKTPAGAIQAIEWADVIMVEYHLEDRTHEEVIAAAADQNVGVVVKKGLASGRLQAMDAIEFVLSNPGVTSMVIGGLDVKHFADNVRIAEAAAR